LAICAPVVYRRSIQDSALPYTKRNTFSRALSLASSGCKK
jgi:hypothetical protein